MKALTHTRFCTCIAWLLMCCVCGSVDAQAQNVQPNEQRFNAGIYKASHNSRERDETLSSQIDNWNCWCLELDLVWHLDNQIRVQHGCGAQESGGLLSFQLGLIAQSVESQDRVTVLYLEMKPACPVEFGIPGVWPARQIYRNYIETALNSALPGGIYPVSEFKTVDQYRWPSYQELLRRGYRWVVILDEEETGFADDDFFFGMARGNPPTAYEANSVLINSDDDDVVPIRGTEPDRWMYRAYPTPFCGTPDDSDYYNDAIASGYTFVATNCIDQSYTMTPLTHSASPLHVVSSGSNTAYGTLSFPYRAGIGIQQAVNRASTRVPIHIATGTYQVSRGTRIDRPVVLHADGGTVRITTP